MNSQFGLQPLKKDERDLKLGSLSLLPKIEELPAGFQLKGVKIKNQRDSDFCSSHMSCTMSEFQEDIELEPSWSFAVSKMLTEDPESYGQNLRDAFKAHVKFGALPSSESPFSLENKDDKFLRRIDNWPDLFNKALPYKKQSYVFITGQYDHFDNIRASMWKFRDEERAVGLGVVWSWPMTQMIMDTYSDFGGGHAISCVGWKTIDGKPYLIIQNSYGEQAGDKGYHYFSREVINKFVGMYGAGMFVDLPVQRLRYLAEHNLKIEDNWIVGLFKILSNWLVDLFKSVVQFMQDIIKIK